MAPRATAKKQLDRRVALTVNPLKTLFAIVDQCVAMIPGTKWTSQLLLGTVEVATQHPLVVVMQPKVLRQAAKVK